MHNKICYVFGLLRKKWGKRTSSTVSWKPLLSNYKNCIKKPTQSCKIVKHFNEKCNDAIVSFRSFRFVMLNVLTNNEYLSKDKIKDFLLKKEILLCGTLAT